MFNYPCRYLFFARLCKKKLKKHASRNKPTTGIIRLSRLSQKKPKTNASAIMAEENKGKYKPIPEIIRRNEARLVPLVSRSKITGKNHARSFVEKKIASQERLVIMVIGEKMKRTYFLIHYDDAGLQMTERNFELDKKFKILNQMVISGYFVAKSKKRVVLYNPDKNQMIRSRSFPSKQSVQFIGNYGGRFTILSLDIMDDVDHTVSQVWVFNTGSATATWEAVETDIKICTPYGSCVCIDKYIYFPASSDKHTAEGADIFIILCFDMIERTIELIELPTGRELSGNHRFVNLQGRLAVVDSEDLMEGNFEIWLEMDKSLFVHRVCNFDTENWKAGTSPNEYIVSHATQKGEIVFTPRRTTQTMKPERPVNVFLYNIQKRFVVILDISDMKVKRNRSLLTGAMHIEDAED